MTKIIIAVSIFIGLSSRMSAQAFDVLQQPIVGGIVSPHDLFNSLLLRTTNPQGGTYTLRISLNYAATNAVTRQVALYEIDKLTLSAGLVSLRSLSYQLNYRSTYLDKTFEGIVSEKGYFPSGEYEVCVQVIELREKTQVNKCQRFNVRSLANLHLVTPSNTSTVLDIAPLFTWLYSGQTSRTQYCIKVFDIGLGQTAEQAVLSNRPLYEACDVRQAVVQYPVQAPKLDNCKQYAWKVDVLENDALQLGSEVWTFNTTCNAQAESQSVVASTYLTVSTDLSGATYETQGILGVQIEQPYVSITDFDVSFLNMDMTVAATTRPTNDLRSKTGLLNGPNMYAFNLVQVGIPRGNYILRLKNQKNTYYQKFRFIN